MLDKEDSQTDLLGAVQSVGSSSMVAQGLRSGQHG